MKTFILFFDGQRESMQKKGRPQFWPAASLVYVADCGGDKPEAG